MVMAWRTLILLSEKVGEFVVLVHTVPLNRCQLEAVSHGPAAILR